MTIILTDKDKVGDYLMSTKGWAYVWSNVGNTFTPVEDSPALTSVEYNNYVLEARDWYEWRQVRSERDRLLKNTDWTQVPDAPVDQVQWALYRQALRDITKQPDPFNIEWPVAPDQGA